MKKDFGASAQCMERILSGISSDMFLTVDEEAAALDVIELLRAKNPAEEHALTEKAALAAHNCGMEDIVKAVAAFLRLLAKVLGDTLEHVVARIKELGSILSVLPT